MAMVSEVDELIASLVMRVNRPVIVALDGRSGAGKSTLAAELADRHQGQAITADDFWCGAGPDQLLSLAPAERADICIDWQRLRAEVLGPLRSGQVARWRPFDWATGIGFSDQELSCPPRRVVVVDGVYSSRPELTDLIDISVLLVLDDATRRAKLLHREGAEFMREWHLCWDAAEDHYFVNVRPPESFDVILSRVVAQDGTS